MKNVEMKVEGQLPESSKKSLLKKMVDFKQK